MKIAVARKKDINWKIKKEIKLGDVNKRLECVKKLNSEKTTMKKEIENIGKARIRNKRLALRMLQKRLETN